jgi:hypothetical protein
MEPGESRHRRAPRIPGHHIDKIRVFPRLTRGAATLIVLIERHSACMAVSLSAPNAPGHTCYQVQVQ